MADQKIFVGSGKEKKFDNGGSIINVTLDLDALAEQFNKHGYVSGQGGRKISIDVCTRRDVDQYGQTHYATLNTWHPGTYREPDPVQLLYVTKEENSFSKIPPEDDIPF